MLLAEDRRQTASISAAWNGTGTAPAGTVVNIAAAAGSVLGVQISGTFTGTLQFEGRIAQTDDVNDWFAITGTPAAGGAGVTSATAAGRWFIQYAGLAAARVRCSAYTSGTPVVSLNLGAGSPASSLAGGAGGSSVTGTLTTNNAAPAANNLGVLPAVANASPPTYTEGDQVLQSTDLSGRTRTLSTVAGTTAPGSASPFPVGIGLNGSGGLLRNVTSALAAYPDNGNLLIAIGTGVFDGTNWHGLLGNTDGSIGVGGFTDVIAATLTRPANTTAYAAGDEMTDTGGAILTLTSAARRSGGTGSIYGITLSCSTNAATKPSLECWIFDTTSTPQTDNAAFAPSDGVVDTLIDVVPLSTSYVGDATSNTGNFVMSSGPLNIPFKCVGSANLFMRIVVRNAYTAGANSDTYKFRVHVGQD